MVAADKLLSFSGPHFPHLVKGGRLFIILPSFLDSCEESSPSTTSFIYDTGIMASNSLYSLVGDPSKDTEYKVPGT